MKNVGIIGCGLVGQKRAKMLKNARLLACADIIREKAEELAKNYPDCIPTENWQDVLDNPAIDIVIIATVHASLAHIALAAIQAEKHILIEKPAAKKSSELHEIIDAALKKNTLVRVGFNHRYHPAFQKARELIDSNALGEIMFIRARYGHGGRLGYEQEWRANPALSGGGELLDQGIHLIDLARWFLGEFSEIDGYANTFFWNMPVDDNGFLLLKTPKKQVAFLHASCTEWKNLFSFEIYGRTGKIDINGLGGSYGVERLTFYKMLPAMGIPEVQQWEFPMEDNSWEVEFAEFLEDIERKRQPAAGLNDAHAALIIVEEIYRKTYDCGA
ncbi:MAG TPA: Gfo/Idh/MocA family oxidoreductase [Gammaproteobacteria bacterium]|nr:Gfo/Idh/MocA family oxidoreductase [Gammaproteobacteria bacterium]